MFQKCPQVFLGLPLLFLNGSPMGPQWVPNDSTMGPQWGHTGSTMEEVFHPSSRSVPQVFLDLPQGCRRARHVDGLAFFDGRGDPAVKKGQTRDGPAGSPVEDLGRPAALSRRGVEDLQVFLGLPQGGGPDPPAPLWKT